MKTEVFNLQQALELRESLYNEIRNLDNLIAEKTETNNKTYKNELLTCNTLLDDAGAVKPVKAFDDITTNYYPVLVTVSAYKDQTAYENEQDDILTIGYESYLDCEVSDSECESVITEYLHEYGYDDVKIITLHRYYK